MSREAATIGAIRPLWTRIEPATRRVPLSGRWLLHAGPAYEPGQLPPPPVLASAALACRHERWVRTDDEAFEIWNTVVGVPAEKIVRIADNKVASLTSWDMELLPIELADLKGVDFDLAPGEIVPVTLTFERSGVKGTMQVSGTHFDLQVKLGMMMSAFKPMIEAEVTKNLGRMIEKASGSSQA